MNICKVGLRTITISKIAFFIFFDVLFLSFSSVAKWNHVFAFEIYLSLLNILMTCDETSLNFCMLVRLYINTVSE